MSLSEETPPREVRILDDWEWAEEQHPELAKMYRGQWVAVYNKQVVAHGADKAQVERDARQKTGRAYNPIYLADPSNPLWTTEDEARFQQDIADWIREQRRIEQAAYREPVAYVEPFYPYNAFPADTMLSNPYLDFGYYKGRDPPETTVELEEPGIGKWLYDEIKVYRAEPDSKFTKYYTLIAKAKYETDGLYADPATGLALLSAPQPVQLEVYWLGERTTADSPPAACIDLERDVVVFFPTNPGGRELMQQVYQKLKYSPGESDYPNRQYD